jgi:hypothetical protein
MLVRMRLLVPLCAFVLIGPLVACTTSTASDGGTGAIVDTGNTGNTGDTGDTGDTGNTTTEAPCDPLAPKAIALGSIVGVGKDASGTFYVDAASGVWMSERGALNRQHVMGTGQSGTNEFIFTFAPSGQEMTAARNLLVETQGSIATTMALGPATSRAFLSQSPAGLTPLTVVDAASVSGMVLVNTPNLISYVGDVTNGDIVMATVPVNADSMSTTGGLSLFYGPTNAVAERPITSFQQSMSGNGTLTFVVGTTPYVLAFGVVQAPDAGPFGAFALLGLTPQGDAQMAVTVRTPTPAALPPGLTFTCLR